MKTFTQWCEELKKDLPIEIVKGKKTTKESTKRTGQTQNYPDAYLRGQYPKFHYLNPYKGTADLDREQKPAKYNGPTAAN